MGGTGGGPHRLIAAVVTAVAMLLVPAAASAATPHGHAKPKKAVPGAPGVQLGPPRSAFYDPRRRCPRASTAR